MKFLKWIFIVITGIIAIVLIIAAFLPAKMEMKAHIQINKNANQVFHEVAGFIEREKWDPWVETDPTAKVTTVYVPGYIGSNYSWDGEKIMTGKIQVDSIVYANYIQSTIGFGKSSDDGTVSWGFNESPSGTDVTWTFSADAGYPVERLYMAMGKAGMQKSLDTGLANLKKLLENKEIQLSTLSEIQEVNRPEMNVMVSEASGTMDEIMPRIGELFGAAYSEIMNQGLSLCGPGFGYYFNYDQAAGTMTVQFGFPVIEKGSSTGKVIARSFPEMKAIKAIHTGPYDEFTFSYNKMMEYIQEKGLNINWDSFEEYITDMDSEPIETLWETAIYFILAD